MSAVNYISQEDVQSSIRAIRLEQILDDDNLAPDQVFKKAVLEAGGLVKDHLLRYKIDEEFDKTGDERNSSVVFHMKNITLYILFDRIPDDDVPEKVIKNYNDTIETLQQISKTKLTINLPLQGTDIDGDGIDDVVKTKFRFGGESPRRF